MRHCIKLSSMTLQATPAAISAATPAAIPANALILGIESSCDETGVALVRTAAQPAGIPQLLAQGLHSQIDIPEDNIFALPNKQFV